MTLPRKQIPTAEEAERELSHKLRMVADALTRIGDNVGGGPLSPPSCGYIDGQLAKAIGWLASARSIVITQGLLADPRFDEGDEVDLDEIWIVAPERTVQDGEGGGSDD